MKPSMETIGLANRIRKHVLEMTNRGGSSHVASAFSMADILAVLYGGGILNFDPTNPKLPSRDRFILSKGHAGAGVYAVLAECGFFPREKLLQHCQDGSDLSGHVSHKGIPGVELSTGSLGHGLPVGTGMAYAGRLRAERHRIFVMLSDGECDEGSNWEAILFAAHHRLSNLVAVVDYNKIQSLDRVENTIRLEPFADKWRSFGWAVREVNGHDHEELKQVFAGLPFNSDQPSVVLAHTTKGKGVGFMENTIEWHYRTARGANYETAMKDLEAGCA